MSDTMKENLTFAMGVFLRIGSIIGVVIAGIVTIKSDIHDLKVEQNYQRRDLEKLSAQVEDVRKKFELQHIAQ